MLGVFRDASVAAYGLKYAVGGVISVGHAMIDPFVEFQSKMAEIRNKGGFDAGVTAQIAEQAKQIGRTTQFSATQAAGAGVELAAAGLNAPGISTALPSVLRFAQASGLSTEQSSTALVETMSQFKLAAKDFEHIGDVMVKAANMSTISVSDMTESLKYVGPIAATAGIPLEKISAIIALLGERGIKGSQAGTGLREILIGLVHPTKQAKKAMAEVGITKKEMQAGLNDIPGFLAKLNAKMEQHKMSTPQRLEVEKMMFGAEALTDVEAIMTSMKTLGTDGKNVLQNYEDAVKSSSGAMSDAAKITGDTLAGKMARLHAAVETAQISLGEKLAPKLTELLPHITDAANATGDWISNNGKLISGFLELIPRIAAAAIAMKGVGLAMSMGTAMSTAGASGGALFGQAWVASALPVIAAGIAGYAFGSVLAKALDMEGVGKKIYDWIHGTSTATEDTKNLTPAEMIARKRRAVSPALPEGAPGAGPAFNMMDHLEESTQEKVKTQKITPEFMGTLDIRVSPDGKPVSYSLKTKGAPMRVGVNVAP
jgi:TP901 family phage tail tape measure protein